jgi:hypothetical protein
MTSPMPHLLVSDYVWDLYRREVDRLNREIDNSFERIRHAIENA